jgi:hypothetical protein
LSLGSFPPSAVATPPSPPNGPQPPIRTSGSTIVGSPLRKYDMPIWDPLFTASIGLSELLQLPLAQLSRFLDVAGCKCVCQLSTTYVVHPFLL